MGIHGKTVGDRLKSEVITQSVMMEKYVITICDNINQKIK